MLKLLIAMAIGVILGMFLWNVLGMQAFADSLKAK